jgi:hypothetical protein
VATFDYNPITGQLDLVGSGGGSYIDGEVEYHSNLPVTVGTPAVNSAFLVRKGEGLYFISRKPAGIWVRELNNGNLDDWKYAGTFSDLYRDANFRILNNADVSKELAFDLSGITTGATRTLTVPDASGTLALQGAITTSGLTQATARILGRTTASTGAIEEIQIGSGLSLSAGELSATGSGVTAVGASTADVLSVSGSDLVADDGNTIDGADPFIKWDDTAGKLVYANPLAFTTAKKIGNQSGNALGTNGLNISCGAAYGGAFVAAGNHSLAISPRGARASGANSLAIGDGADCTAGSSTAVGSAALCSSDGLALGASANCSGSAGAAVGVLSVASAVNTFAGPLATANLRAMVSFRPFNAIYWGGQTTNDTPLILNLDASATNRFTIAANTALAVDILLVARRSDTADKWLVARRFLGIRRDGSNNTSLIGSVQTLGVDQSDGSPTWSFALTADDTNEALQLEVTGAASETVQWRATAFYRVV